MNLRVLLVDDEPLAIRRLEALLTDMPDVEVVGSARDGEEAAVEVARLNPDLVLLDIRMPRQGGVPLARSLRKAQATEVIFVTAFDHFALEAFDADAVDYLIKPVEADRLQVALDKARRRRVGSAPVPAEVEPAEPRGDGYLDGFWVETRQSTKTWVPLAAVRWIEAARDYVILHTDKGSYLMRSTMEGLENQVTSRGFMRVSRSAYVRIDAVEGFHKQGSYSNMLVMADGTMVRVGVSFVAAVTARFEARRAPPNSVSARS